MLQRAGARSESREMKTEPGEDRGWAEQIGDSEVTGTSAGELWYRAAAAVVALFLLVTVI